MSLGIGSVIVGVGSDQIGQPNGLASLDGAGKVPSGQLPSYVDDVLEAANFAALPVTGETGKIYVTLDNSKSYRWSGSAYVEITNFTEGQVRSTLLTGLQTVGNNSPIAATDSVLLGFGKAQAQIGAYGVALDAVAGDLDSHATNTNNPHGTTASQVGAVAKAGDTMTGKLNLPAVTTASAPLSLGSANVDPASPAVGDVWVRNNAIKYRGNSSTVNTVAATTEPNVFSVRQTIQATDNTFPALRVTQLGTGEALRVEDETNPDSTAFVVNGTGKVGIGVAPDASVCLSLDSTGVKFSDGSTQTTAGVAKTGDTMTGKLNLPASTTTNAPLNLGSGVSPTTPVAGDVFASGNNIFFKGTTGGPYIFAYKNDTNTFLVPQIISTVSPTGDSAPALRITQAGGGEALRVEDSTTPDTTAFVVSTTGRVGIGVAPDASVCLSLDSTGVKFSDGSIQKTAMQPYTVVEHFLQGNLSLNNLRNLTGGGGSSSSAATARQYNSTGVVTVVTGTNAVIAHSAMGIDQVNENAVDLSQASKNIFSSRCAFFTLPDASATGMWYSGFVDNYNVVSTNGAYFRIVNAGNLEAVCVSAGVETTQNLGFRPATGAMHLYEVIARDNGTAVDFWYDGGLVATIISNIPTGNTQRVNYAAGIMRLSTVVTTSLEFDLDLVFVRLYNTGFTLQY